MVESPFPTFRSSSEGSDDVRVEPAAAAAASAAAAVNKNTKEAGATTEDPPSMVPAARRSILIRGGSRSSKRLDSVQSIKFALDNNNNNNNNNNNHSDNGNINDNSANVNARVPEPIEEELPQFMDIEEREKSIKLARQLAAKALTDEGVEAVQQPPRFRLNCCGGPPPVSSLSSVSTATSDTEGEITEETFNRLSSKRVNSIVEERLNKELAGGPAVIREDSFKIQDAVVSFSSFISSKQVPSPAAGKETDRPVPLVSYLPPSPLFTFDGKLGVECMAFKIDFTDTLNNIVPPYFLAHEKNFTEKQKETLKKGISFAKEVDLFGQETVQTLGKELPAPKRKSLNLLN